MCTVLVRGGVRLPCSSPRGAREKFAKLLSYVDPDGEHGFGFEGKFVKPGQVLTDAELQPAPEFPAIPVLLEFMKGPAYGLPGHRRCDQVYILWRLSEDRAWKELGRAVSTSWEWALELRPLAVRALREARGGPLVRVLPDLGIAAARISKMLTRELQALEDTERHKLIGVLHDEFAVRLSG